MNNEYVYENGKVLIIDDTTNNDKINYYDNLDKVLIKENVIEEIEDEIEYLEDETKNFNIDKAYKKIKITRFALIFGFALAPFVLFGIFCPSIIEAIVLEILLAPGMAAGGAAVASVEVSGIKEYIKENRGMLAQLNYLKEQLKKEKISLEELKKDLTNSKTTNELERVKINAKAELKSLKRWLNSVYKLGYNEKKLYKQYKNNKLDSKQEKNYTIEELQYFKKYLKEQGPVLSKRTK